ncbi:MAG: sulfotransferase domain-containing protein [Gallionella sp.]|nr:sulfotransferase domain-containing protein [Gallionella sp.]MDD4958643.1 sulfotransferase domain-containing protein [Gallionella sp.]
MNGFYWIASYPKSGNTWVRLFLEALLAGTLDINRLKRAGGHAAVRAEFDRLLDIPSSDLTDDEITNARPCLYQIEANAATRPMFRKAHDAWHLTPAGKPLFPPELTLGAVYLVRDPRDVTVSLAHHLAQDIDQAITRMNDPTAVMEHAKLRMQSQLPQRLLTWQQHVQSWLNAPIPVLLVKYEDLLADPITRFSEIADFLKLTVTPEQIAAAVQTVQFDRLHDLEAINGFAEKPPNAKQFFRRGIAGGWQDTLSTAQIEQIETHHAEMMRELGYLSLG